MILTKEICELYFKKTKQNNVVLLASWLMKIVILVI